MIPLYNPPDMALWTGRIDDEINFDAFRFHQWVKPLDLADASSKPYPGKLAIAFLGFASDIGVGLNLGRVGASKGPNAIRLELRNKPCSSSKDLALFDAGDIVAEGAGLLDAQHALAQAVEQLLNLNYFPVLLGGGHEIAYGHYLGLEAYVSKRYAKSIGILNFDAHFDLRPYPNGGSSGTMFRQIADHCADIDLPFHYFCIGVQKSGNTKALFKTAESLKARHLLAVDLSEGDMLPHLDVLDRFTKNKDFLYTTICMDVFSSAFAPGVSSAQPLGMNPERLLKLLKHLVKSGKLLSFDIAEVSPRFDYDNSTANLASIVIFALITTLASVYDLEE